MEGTAGDWHHRTGNQGTRPQQPDVRRNRRRHGRPARARSLDQRQRWYVPLQRPTISTNTNIQLPGFDCHEQRRQYIRDTLATSTPGAYASTVERLSAQLLTLLDPLFSLNPVYNRAVQAEDLLMRLYNIVDLAGRLNLQMRQTPHTIYHVPHTCKDDRLDDTLHDVLNGAYMRETNPLYVELNDEGSNEAEIKERWTWSALTRVVGWDGVVAYRKGGWRDGEDKKKGFRVRRITRSKVALRWGKPRRFGKGKDGKGVDDGYKELYEVIGKGV